jgi:hypothetical protein
LSRNCVTDCSRERLCCLDAVLISDIIADENECQIAVSSLEKKFYGWLDVAGLNLERL